MWKESSAEAEVGAVGLAYEVPGLDELVDVPAPGKRLVGDADAERHREHRELAQVVDQERQVAARVRGSRRAGEQHLRAERLAHLQHRLGDVDLVVVQVARQALEVAQHLEAGDAQPAVAHRGNRGFLAAGMADDVGGVEHDLREAGALIARSLASSGPASVIVSMPKWSRFMA